MRQNDNNLISKGAALLLAAFQSGCTGIPDNYEVVSGFELNRYLGTWYEIARLDHRFERDMSNVTATYSLREGGGVTVVNRGYISDKGKWKESTGKAFFVGDADKGQLKVSFFGPFYGGYNIIALDDDYQYAMVAGPNRKYLWILARTSNLEQGVIDALLNQANGLGFPTNDLIYVEHSKEQ